MLQGGGAVAGALREPAEAQVAARGQRAHPELSGQRERPGEVGAGLLDVGRAPRPRGQAEQPLRVDRVAALAVRVGLLEGAPRVRRRRGGLAREQPRLAQVGHDQGEAPEPLHALGLPHPALGQLERLRGPAGQGVDHRDVPRERGVERGHVPAQRDAALEQALGLPQVTAADEGAAQTEQRIGDAVGVAAGLREPQPLLGGLHRLVELAELGEGPAELRADEHRRDAGQAESLGARVGREQREVAPQDHQGLSVVAERPSPLPDVVVADDLQAGVPGLLRDGERPLPHPRGLVGRPHLPVHVALERERARQPRLVAEALPRARPPRAAPPRCGRAGRAGPARCGDRTGGRRPGPRRPAGGRARRGPARRTTRSPSSPCAPACGPRPRGSSRPRGPTPRRGTRGGRGARSARRAASG